MWILHFLPDALILWFCNILLVVGLVLTVAGFFAHRIPVIWQYQLPFRFLGIALLVLGVYFRGGYAVEAEWRERVAEVEARLAVAEQKSVATNTKIDTVAKEKIRVIRGQTQIVLAASRLSSAARTAAAVAGSSSGGLAWSPVTKGRLP